MEDYFRLNILSMVPNGLWPFPNETKSEKKKKIIFAVNFLLISPIIYGIMMRGISDLNNVVHLADDIASFFTQLANLSKGIIFLYKRESMREMFRLVDELLEQTPFDKTNIHVKNLTNKWQHRTHLIVKIIALVYLVTYSAYMSFPWFAYFFKGVFIFPVPVKFPFDTNHFGAFLPTYIWIFMEGTAILFIFISNETLFMSLILYLCSRVDVLKYGIVQSAKDATEEGKTTGRFNDSVEYHKKILRLCTMIESLYSPVLLIQFCASTTTICMICFLTTTQKIEPGKKLPFIIFLGSLLMQLFVYCFFSQKLESKFEGLCDTGFYSTWYETTSISYKKNILIFLMRCSQPVTLTAYKLMPANLASFFSICKTCVSYIAILRNLEEEQIT